MVDERGEGMTETKVCSKCGEEKPINEFHLSGKTAFHRIPYCRNCINTMS